MIIEYFLFFLVSVVGLFLTGSAILIVLKSKFRNVFSFYFASLVSGLFIFIVSYALFKSQGITVLSGAILVSALFYYLIKHQNISQQEKQIELCLSGIFYSSKSWVLLALIPICFLSFYVNIENVTEISKVGMSLHRDFYWWAANSDQLRESGFENIFNYNNQLNSLYNVLTPYHYFELWLTAGIADCFTIPTLIADRLLTLPLLILILIIGFLALAELYIERVIVQLLFALAALFFTGIFATEFLGFVEKFKIGPLSATKYDVQYIWVIASILLILNHRVYAAIAFLSALPLLSIATAPAVYLGSFIFLFWSYFMYKKYRSEVLIAGSSVILSFVFLITFYGIAGTSQSEKIHHLDSINQFGFIHIFSIQGLKTFIYLIAVSVLQILWIYSPYWILFLMLKFRHRKINEDFQKAHALERMIAVLFSFIIFSGLMVWAAISYLQNSLELFTNIAAVSLNVLVPLFLLISYKNLVNSMYRKILVTVFVIHLLYNTSPILARVPEILGFSKMPEEQELVYDTEYIQSIIDFAVSDNSNIYGGLYFSETENPYLKNNMCGKLSYNLMNQGNYLSLINNKLKLIPVFICDKSTLYGENANPDNSLFVNSVFYRFIKQQIEINDYQNMDHSLNMFVEKYNLKFILLKGNSTLPGILEKKVERIFRNEKTNEQFIVLRNKVS